MPKQKPFLNYQNQINTLITKKGLIINNPSFAEKKLQDIRYYALIDGYKSIFYDYTTRTYLPGTTFEDIVNLYDFDENLRLLVFKYICHIEQRIRSQISYYFCDKYSSSQNDYLNPNHYNYSKRNKSGINKLNIPKTGSSYSVGKNDLFAIIIALRYLLPKEDFKHFYKNLKAIIFSYQKKSTLNNTTKLLDSMGFHSTWNTILRYKP